MKFYFDIYFAVNFVMDFILLCITGKIMKTELRFFRIFLAALSAALLSFVPILFQSFTVSLCCTVFIPGIMILISFGKRSWSTLFQTVSILFGISFISGGVYNAVAEKAAEVHAAILFIIIFLTMLFCVVFFDIFSFKNDCEPIEIKIFANGKSQKCKLLCDSGSLVKEPISGLFVIILSQKTFDRLYNEKNLGNYEFAVKNKLRLVPIKTASGSTVIKAVLPQAITYTYKKKTIKCNAMIGRSENESFAGFDGIFPKGLLKLKYKQEYDHEIFTKSITE